jgi:predicted deacylase
MIINKTEIKLGENKDVELRISKLASGTIVSLRAQIFRSKNEGPTLLITGGVHGDEINGVEIVRQAIKSGLFDGLNRGSVIAIPLVNIDGFNNFSRDLPDGKDVNRSFPGSKNGSLAARVANTISTLILPLVDYGLDFHTGGASIHNHPQVRVNKKDEQSLALANVFNAPVTVETGLVSKSLRKEAYLYDIPMVVFEGGESLRIDQTSINEGIRGIKRVLSHYKMIDQAIPSQDTQIIKKHKWLRAVSAGIFVPLKTAGEHFKTGDILGVITNPYNEFENKIIAKQDGFIFGHDNKPVINQGKALFHVGS